MKSRDFYTKVLASTLVFLFLILFLSTASASATAQNASTTMIYAYITNEGSDNVSVIDTTNNTVIATVSVGGRYPDAVAVTPDGTKVYVASYDDVMSSVSVIDTATNNVRHTVDGLFNVGQIAFSPDGKKAYVTNYDSVSVIDTTTDSVTATVPVGNSPYGIAVNPNGTKAYVTHVWSDTVSVIDTATNTVIATVPVGHIPIGVSVTPDGKKVYVANHDSSIVSVIDTDINTVIATVPVGSYPNLVAISPDGTKVYVTNWISNDVSIIDTATDNVIATVNVGKGPQGLSVTPDGTKVYVANYDSNDISVIDTATNTVIDRVPVGINPVARGNFIGLVPIQEGTNLCLSSQAPANKDHGSSMTYTLHYNNFGDASAHNVVLEDILDNNVAFVSASDGGVYDSNTGTIRWDIGSVNSSDNGYRTMNVSIPQDVPVRAVIVNNANISTSDLDVRYYDNEAQARTSVTGLTLPANIKVEPNNGGIGTPSVYWGNPVTFSYHNTGLPVTGVNITIHFDDGLPDITGTMANVTNSTSDWTYTTTLYPRHGKATVIYTKQLDPEPYTPSYDVRGDYGDFITADDIYNYIKDKYPQSPMLSEPDIGSRFINSATTYGIDPVFLVSLAEVDSQFGTVGWAAEHPEAHNAFGYGVVYDNNTTQLYGASSWGDMVDQVAWSIAKGPNFFQKVVIQ